MRSKVQSIVSYILCISLAVIMIITPVVETSAAKTDSVNRDVLIDQLLEQGEYVEGEAIAIVKSNRDNLSVQNEEVMSLSKDSLIDTINSAELENTVQSNAVKERLGFVSGEYSLRVVTDNSRSTRSILYELYEDSSVVYAEPNYISTPPDDMGNEALISNNKRLNNTNVATTVGDMTDAQWYLGDTTHKYSTPYAPEPFYMLNVPGWIENRTNENAPANASGTVCIMDTGIDTSHPDLQNVMYHFTAEQQAKYHCGEYGINTSIDSDEEGDYRDISDYHQHGTHVAGIIGAQWNSFGTSGIANGIKIFGVRIFGNDGSSSTTLTDIRSFRFLIDVAKEVNLKAVNCSWGNGKARFVLNALANELGHKGVTTVFASGNVSENKDELPDTGPSMSNVYTVNVNSCSPNGKKDTFSNYGLNSTDLFSAGSGILSSMPQEVDYQTSSVYNVKKYMRFFPEATNQAGLLYGVDTATVENMGFRIFDSNPITNPDAQEITAKSNSMGYGDKNSYAVKLNSMKDLSAYMNSESLKAEKGFYMAIPTDNVDALRYIGLKDICSDGHRTIVGLATLTYKNADGNPVEIDHKSDLAMHSGYQSTIASNTYNVQWVPLSFNVKGTMDTVNAARVLSEEDKAKVFENFGGFTDPGELTGVYGWEKDGKTYVIVGFGKTSSDPSSPAADENTTIYLDNIGLGNENAGVGAYNMMSGTSMATPTVTGALAVIARDEPSNSTLSDNELSQMALERTAKLLASVDYDDSLLPYCRTGGRMNLNFKTEYNNKAPLIESAKSDGNELVLSGYFFGNEQGSVKIDGNLVNTTRWSDNSVIADVSGISNGSHVAMIEKASGERMQVVFSNSSEDKDGLKLYEKEMSLPVNLPEFVNDNSEMINDNMAVLNDSIYVANKNLDGNVIGIWRYIINEDRWVRCSDIPIDDKLKTIYSMVGWNGKLYVSANMSTPYKKILSYDPNTDKWELVDLELTDNAGRLAVMNDKLFFIIGDMGNWKSAGETPVCQIAIIDPENKTVKKLSGAVPDNNVVASGNYLYSFNKFDDGSGEKGSEMNYHLYRGEYNETKGEVVFTELNNVLGNLFNKKYMEEVQLCGLDGGVVFVGHTNSGTDTYLLSDNDTSLKPYYRTSSYHLPNKVTAASGDGWLYVFATDAQENDGAYFRATNVEPENDEGSGDEQSGNGTSVIEGVTRKVTKAPKTGDDFLTL